MDTTTPISTNAGMREKVKERYGAAVSSGGSCCGKAGDTLSIQPASGSRQARTSFGCGDPLAVVPLAPGDIVVDIGSGPGADAFAAARAVGPSGRVFGIDMTPAMLETARRNAREANLANVDFLEGDAERLPLPDGAADWVISNCVINLVPDKVAAFREIARVLKPGGRISISDLVGENLPEAILADTDKFCECIGGAPSESEYLDAIRHAGLEDVRIEDRFEWPVPELAGTNAHVWSLRITARRPLSI